MAVEAIPSFTFGKTVMCDPVSLGIAALVVGVGSTVVGGIQQGNANNEQRAYNAKIEGIQKQYRLDVMEYQNSDYANNVDFYTKQIAWEKAEFEKTKTHVADSKDAIQDNFFGNLAAQVTQAVELDIATALGIADTNTQVLTETGALEARMADSGVGGNSAAIMRGDIQRQGGNARNMHELNSTSARRQLGNEMLGTKAQRDGQLASIQIPTFQPIAPPKPPGPVSPINPSAPVASPSAAAIGLSAVSNGINLGLSGYNFGKAMS